VHGVEVPNTIKENDMVSPLNIINPFAKRMNPGAFHGEMNCPFCSVKADPTTTPMGFETDKTKIRLVGTIGPFVREYKCMLCGGVWRYDIAGHSTHPYDSFKKGLKNNPVLNAIKSTKFKKHYIK